MKSFVIDRSLLDGNLAPDYYDPQFSFLRKLPLRMKEVADIRKKQWKPSLANKGSFNFIDIADVNAQMGIIVTAKAMTSEEPPFKQSNCWHVKTGDVVISLFRPWRGGVAIVPKRLDGAIVSKRFAVLRARNCSPALIWVWLRLPQVAEFLQTLTPTFLSPKELTDIPFPGTLSAEVLATAEKATDRILDLPVGIVSDSDSGYEPLVEKLNLPTDFDEGAYKGYIDRSELTKERLDPFYYLTAAPDEIFERSMYEVLPLNKVAKTLKTGTPTGRGNDGDTVLVLGPGQLTNGRLYTQGANEANIKRSPTIVQMEDVVITLVGSKTGEAGLVDDEAAGCCINNNLALVRPSDEILPGYLVGYLNSRVGRYLVKQNLQGIATPYLRLSSLQKMPIVVPPVAIQQTIVNELEETTSGKKHPLVRKDVIELEDRLRKLLYDQIGFPQ